MILEDLIAMRHRMVSLWPWLETGPSREYECSIRVDRIGITMVDGEDDPMVLSDHSPSVWDTGIRDLMAKQLDTSDIIIATYEQLNDDIENAREDAIEKIRRMR